MNVMRGIRGLLVAKTAPFAETHPGGTLPDNRGKLRGSSSRGKIAESKECMERAHHIAILFFLFGFDMASMSAAYRIVFVRLRVTDAIESKRRSNNK